MKIYCKICQVELTNELVILKDSSLLCEEDGCDLVPLGFYFLTDKSYPVTGEMKIVINLKDLKNEKRHSDLSRTNGCCGLDGLDGINTVCINDHEIGTQSSDCWMPHYFTFESDLIEVHESHLH